MIPKLLISCPSCELSGKRNILGEVKDGYFLIMRFHNNYTKIKGEFEVICNTCNESVYFRTERKLDANLPYNGTFGLLGNAPDYQAGTARI